MKNTKKALLMTLCAVMLVAASVMGTLAYLQDAEQVTNTFTVGNVQILLDEKDTDGSKTEVTTAGRDKANSYKLIPGGKYEKDPTVTVTNGSEESYVRMLVTIDKQEALDKIFAEQNADLKAIFVGYDETKWELVKETENANGIADTRTYEFRYHDTVDASQATVPVKLEALFTHIQVPGFIDNEQLSSIEGMTINVEAHAIQAAGFANADAAWDAFTK